LTTPLSVAFGTHGIIKDGWILIKHYAGDCYLCGYENDVFEGMRQSKAKQLFLMLFDDSLSIAKLEMSGLL
jgi:hypothetical protein